MADHLESGGNNVKQQALESGRLFLEKGKLLEKGTAAILRSFGEATG